MLQRTLYQAHQVPSGSMFLLIQDELEVAYEKAYSFVEYLPPSSVFQIFLKIENSYLDFRETVKSNNLI